LKGEEHGDFPPLQGEGEGGDGVSVGVIVIKAYLTRPNDQKWRVTMRNVLIVIFSMAILISWSVPVVGAQFLEAGVEKFRVAVDAPDFTLNELGGRKISLKELRGKIILLNFFASW
jgi:hypothetical protein